MNKQLRKSIFLSLITVLATIFFSFTSAIAQESPFYWDYVNVNIDVQNNGDMLISEKQKYMFNSEYSRQRYRYIRLHKVDEIKDITVEENNLIIPSTTGIKNNHIWIRWQHSLKPPEAHTFIIKYRVVGGLHINNNNAQVYWKAIFAKRTAPIKAAKVRVKLPETLAGQVLDFRSFGASATSQQINSTTFEFMANQPVVPQQELEVKVTFPNNILNLTQPNWQKVNFFNQMTIFLVVIFLSLGIIIFMTRRKTLTT